MFGGQHFLAAGVTEKKERKEKKKKRKKRSVVYYLQKSNVPSRCK